MEVLPPHFDVESTVVGPNHFGRSVEIALSASVLSVSLIFLKGWQPGLEQI